jgi:broad specificity phosphatase PhoE
VPLTPLGEQQAQALAQTWDFVPGRILVSPYLRTQQTAAPTIARFPDVPVENWDIHEFTYWDRDYWGDTTPEEEFEEVVRYWRIADPDFRMGANGNFSESFADLLRRTETTLDKLVELDSAAPVILFSHGHFMQALRHTLQWPHWTYAQKMANFRAHDEMYRVLNTEKMVVEWEGKGKWRLV